MSKKNINYDEFVEKFEPKKHVWKYLGPFKRIESWF